MARGELRALVATASLDLGVDWGDIDLVVQMGAPKGSSRLLQRIGRAGHRLDSPSRALLVPGNRFEFLEAMAAQDAVKEGQRDGEDFRPGALDVLAQHVMAVAWQVMWVAIFVHFGSRLFRRRVMKSGPQQARTKKSKGQPAAA